MSVPWYLMAKGKGGGGYKTASGPIVSVNDALAAPLRSLLVNIEPVQDLHGYDNPWPAGGGKNLFGFEEYLKANNVTYTKNGNTYTVTIVDSSLFQNPWVFSDADVAVTISASAYTAGTVTNPRIDLLNSDGNVVSNISPAYLTNQGTACKARINWSTTGTFTISEPMIELGNAKTSFAPYSNICPISGWSEVNVWVKPTYDPTANPTATIQLGDTYYGGTLDVTNGVLTVDRAMVDLGTLTWVHRGEDVAPGMFASSTFTDYLHSDYVKVLCSIYSYKGTVNAVQQVPQKGDKVLCLYYNFRLPEVSSLYAYDTTYTDA
ncbi:MAG: hypothetical protein II347_03085, partial [Lachnospiraceae bacterium]|nr:hypothetical protein [Lachnospiraceae bacterium]